MVRPAEYPPPFRSAEFVDQPGGGRPRTDRGGRRDRGGGAGRAGLRHPAGPAAGGPPGRGRSTGRGAGRGGGEGQADRLPSAVGRGAQPDIAAVPVRRSGAARRGTHLRPGAGRAGLRAHRTARALPIPTPPPMRNRGNVIVSLSRLGRWLADPGGRGRGHGAGRDGGGNAAGRRRPGGGGTHRGQGPRPDGGAARQLRARQRNRGPPHGPGRGNPGAPDRGGPGSLRAAVAGAPDLGAGGQRSLAGAPTVGPGHPHHGLATSAGAQYREFGGSFIYPLGAEHAAIGMVVGLDYRDATCRCTTCFRS